MLLKSREFESTSASACDGSRQQHYDDEEMLRRDFKPDSYKAHNSHKAPSKPDPAKLGGRVDAEIAEECSSLLCSPLRPDGRAVAGGFGQGFIGREENGNEE